MLALILDFYFSAVIESLSRRRQAPLVISWSFRGSVTKIDAVFAIDFTTVGVVSICCAMSTCLHNYM